VLIQTCRNTQFFGTAEQQATALRTKGSYTQDCCICALPTDSATRYWIRRPATGLRTDLPNTTTGQSHATPYLRPEISNGGNSKKHQAIQHSDNLGKHCVSLSKLLRRCHVYVVFHPACLVPKNEAPRRCRQWHTSGGGRCTEARPFLGHSGKQAVIVPLQQWQPASKTRKHA